MELKIRKYCSITPEKLCIDGQKLIDVGIHESLEKSLVHIYRSIGLDYVKFFKMDNLSKLAVLASECVLKNTGLYDTKDNDNVAVVLSNASSSIVTDINYHKTIDDRENYFPSPSLFVYTLPNITIGEICIKYKIFGENVFFISRQFDPSAICLYVNELFKKTNTRFCLTGWVECNIMSYDAFLLLIDYGNEGITFDEKNMNNLYKVK